MQMHCDVPYMSTQHSAEWCSLPEMLHGWILTSRGIHLPAGMEVRPTQMRPFMKVPVVMTAARHLKVIPKNVRTPVTCKSADHISPISSVLPTMIKRVAQRMHARPRPPRGGCCLQECNAKQKCDTQSPLPEAFKSTSSFGPDYPSLSHFAHSVLSAGMHLLACAGMCTRTPHHWVPARCRRPCPHACPGWGCAPVAVASRESTPACLSARAAPTPLDPVNMHMHLVILRSEASCRGYNGGLADKSMSRGLPVICWVFISGLLTHRLHTHFLLLISTAVRSQ